MNINQLDKTDYDVLWFVDTENDPIKDVNLLIKVTSTTVHRMLVRPERCFSAMKELKDDAAAKAALSNVLVAAWRPCKYSLVTMMRNMNTYGYMPLEPEKLPKRVLWGGLVKLFKDTLIPLARCRVVHIDIRWGWKHVANVLRKVNDENESVDMCLIDFESLCEANNEPDVIENRSFQWDQIPSLHLEDKQRNGFRFVWWQCLTLAYVLLFEVSIEDSTPTVLSSFVDSMSRNLENDETNRFLQKFLDEDQKKILAGVNKPKIKQTDVENLMEMVGKAFPEDSKESIHENADITTVTTGTGSNSRKRKAKKLISKKN